MDISNMDLSFGTQDTRGGSLFRDILAELQMWRRNTARKNRQKRRIFRPVSIDDHLLRDIGMTRLGMSEATLANQNEAAER